MKQTIIVSYCFDIREYFLIYSFDLISIFISLNIHTGHCISVLQLQLRVMNYLITVPDLPCSDNCIDCHICTRFQTLQLEWAVPDLLNTFRPCIYAFSWQRTVSVIRSFAIAWCQFFSGMRFFQGQCNNTNQHILFSPGSCDVCMVPMLCTMDLEFRLNMPLNGTVHTLYIQNTDEINYSKPERIARITQCTIKHSDRPCFPRVLEDIGAKSPLFLVCEVQWRECFMGEWEQMEQHRWTAGGIGESRRWENMDEEKIGGETWTHGTAIIYRVNKKSWN